MTREEVISKLLATFTQYANGNVRADIVAQDEMDEAEKPAESRRDDPMSGDSRNEQNHVEAFWQSYLDTLPPDSPTREEPYEAGMFGDSPELADELGALISAGTKTATCSALWEYEAEDEPIPKVGEGFIVLGGDGSPLCAIETTGVEVRPYDEVDADFAFLEGDRSLEYWREAHWNFFSRTPAGIGKEPTMDMPLVCERFRVVHK